MDMDQSLKFAGGFGGYAVERVAGRCAIVVDVLGVGSGGLGDGGICFYLCHGAHFHSLIK